MPKNNSCFSAKVGELLPVKHRTVKPGAKYKISADLLTPKNN